MLQLGNTSSAKALPQQQSGCCHELRAVVSFNTVTQAIQAASSASERHARPGSYCMSAAGEGPGQPSGPLMLLGWQEALSQQPAPATITADGPTKALAITPAAFLQLLRETPVLQHHFVAAAAADFRHAQAALQVRATARVNMYPGCGRLPG